MSQSITYEIGRNNMKNISMAWTKDAFIAGRKSKTRRKWTEKYAQRFKVGDICQVYDRQPRFGGKPIGKIKIVGIGKEPISEMPDTDFEKEGFAYMEENGLKIWGKPPRVAFHDWRQEGGEYWVVEFHIQ